VTPPFSAARRALVAAARSGYRILITGSRHMKDPAPLSREISRVLEEQLQLGSSGELPEIVLVHGAGPGEPGCDALVHELWERKFKPLVQIEPHPPVPQKFGPWPGAGPRRNSHMVKLGADICLAFPCSRSKGTVDCMTKAWKAGIPTRVLLVDP